MDHPHFKVYVLYFTSFLVIGIIFTGLGPLFPYLAAIADHIETGYLFLFLCRAGGYIFGSLVIKSLQKYLTIHFLAGTALFLNVFAILFMYTESLAIKGIYEFLLSIGGLWRDITINVAIIETFSPNQWMAAGAMNLLGSEAYWFLCGVFI